mmetsp:Transcript_291/g.525  ORF Transcript_291/g.525 Transcript_291/m.525 type:complete len:346 (+) Transcript_291:294-1331(+)
MEKGVRVSNGTLFRIALFVSGVDGFGLCLTLVHHKVDIDIIGIIGTKVGLFMSTDSESGVGNANNHKDGSKNDGGGFESIGISSIHQSSENKIGGIERDKSSLEETNGSASVGVLDGRMDGDEGDNKAEKDVQGDEEGGDPFVRAHLVNVHKNGQHSGSPKAKEGRDKEEGNILSFSGFFILFNPALVQGVSKVNKHEQLEENKNPSTDQSNPTIGNKERIGDNESNSNQTNQEKKLDRVPVEVNLSSAIALVIYTNSSESKEEMEHKQRPCQTINSNRARATISCIFDCGNPAQQLHRPHRKHPSNHRSDREDGSIDRLCDLLFRGHFGTARTSPGSGLTTSTT